MATHLFFTQGYFIYLETHLCNPWVLGSTHTYSMRWVTNFKMVTLLFSTKHHLFSNLLTAQA